MNIEDQNCNHEVLMPVLCRKCMTQLVAHEEEIHGVLVEIAGFCPNDKCEFYEVLIA